MDIEPQPSLSNPHPSSLNNPHSQFYASQCYRLLSFESYWPTTQNPRPNELSAAGFYYTLKGDIVRCFYCGGCLRDWEERDNPWKEHAKWFPECEFVKLMKGQKFINSMRLNLLYNIQDDDIIKQQSKPQSVHSANIDESVAKEKENDNKLCKICFERNCDIVIIPCGHIATCLKCSENVYSCPICRTDFDTIFKIYFS